MGKLHDDISGKAACGLAHGLSRDIPGSKMISPYRQQLSSCSDLAPVEERLQRVSNTSTCSASPRRDHVLHYLSSAYLQSVG